MISLTLLNEKGGVGKTTLATHIAAGLAIKGYRVILVDGDPQGNSTAAVGLTKEPAFYDLCVRGAAWKDVLVGVHPDVYSPPEQTAKGALYCISSNVETRNIANSIRSNVVVRQRFRELDGVVDYVIVDTSPTPSLLNEAIALASDYILIPTDCEAFSALEGLPDSLEHAAAAESAVAEIGIKAARVIGIVPNQYRERTVGHNILLDQMRERYGELVWEPISQGIAFSDVQLMQQFLFGGAPSSKATDQIWSLIHRFEQVVASEQA